jgi:hypothetical protein
MTLQFKQNSLEYLFNGSYSGPTRRAIVALTYTHSSWTTSCRLLNIPTHVWTMELKLCIVIHQARFYVHCLPFSASFIPPRSLTSSAM